MHIQEELSQRHVLSLTVSNEAGMLARIAGLFTARGYNIDSLTVADITPTMASAASPSSPTARPR